MTDAPFEHDASLALDRLSGWYTLQCDGDWEHGLGIRIETVDNPGWSLKVDLNETSLRGCKLQRTTIQRTQHNWIIREVKNLDGRLTYCSFGGPSNLSEMVLRFVEWVAGENPRGWENSK